MTVVFKYPFCLLESCYCEFYSTFGTYTPILGDQKYWGNIHLCIKVLKVNYLVPYS